jgi:hypothetical protein
VPAGLEGQELDEEAAGGQVPAVRSQPTTDGVTVDRALDARAQEGEEHVEV